MNVNTNSKSKKTKLGPPLFIPDEHLRWLSPSPPHLLLHIHLVPHQVTGVNEDVTPVLKDLASPSDTNCLPGVMII